MYLDDNSPIAGGREIWVFPKKLATPKITHEQETLVDTLHHGSVLCVSATMGYKHRELDLDPIAKAVAQDGRGDQGQAWRCFRGRHERH
jgi:acetoacetate decarboxylase